MWTQVDSDQRALRKGNTNPHWGMEFQVGPQRVPTKMFQRIYTRSQKSPNTHLCPKQVTISKPAGERETDNRIRIRDFRWWRFRHLIQKMYI